VEGEFKMTAKRFRVPDYDINIKPHELLIINTPTFQRLFKINQLGLAYLVRQCRQGDPPL
jgi:hypothetical protein